MSVVSANRFEVRKMEEKEKDLLKMYETAFKGAEQHLSLVAVSTFSRFSQDYEKEEIRTIAEILLALAKAPTVLQR
ncbi:hypothetical protein EGX24_16355 [Enterococcus gallinarum]|nr:hypothetical protein EGW90_16345 [Enterococcus gallinarum]ROZ31516.1 hypothetical protein EGX24_16355 [Enterococcus gallinarum]